MLTSALHGSRAARLGTDVGAVREEARLSSILHSIHAVPDRMCARKEHRDTPGLSLTGRLLR